MIELKIDGATCQGCVNSIEKSIALVSGVASVKFDLDSKLAKIDGNPEMDAVVDAVETAGFEVLTDEP